MPIADTRIELELVDADDGDVAAHTLAELQERLLSVKFVDHERQKDLLELTLRNEDLALLEDPMFEKGQKVEFAWGYPGFMAPRRRMVVQASKGTDTLTVTLHDTSALMDLKPAMRHEEGLTDAEFVALIAEANGYIGPLCHIQYWRPDGSPLAKRESITQNRTDAAMCAWLAARNRFQFFIDATGFHWHARQVDRPPLWRYEWRTDPGQGDILEPPQIEVNLAKDIAKVRVVARDPITMEPIVAIGGPDDTVFASLGAEDAVADPDGTDLGLRERRVSHGVTQWAGFMSAAVAADRAGATFRETAQGRYKLTLVVKGNPAIAAKNTIDVEGIGPTFSGLYYLTEVETELGSRGPTQTLHGIKDAAAEVKAARKRGTGKRQPVPAPTPPSPQLSWEIVLGADANGKHESNWIARDPCTGAILTRQTIATQETLELMDMVTHGWLPTTERSELPDF